MQFSTSAVRTILTASRRYALMGVVCVATSGLIACGSDEKKPTATGGTGATTTTGGTTTGTTTATSGGTTTGTTTGAINCDASGNSSYQGTPASVSYAAAGGNVSMPYALFTHNPNATDPNKKWVVSFFDYDYCAFSYDHGYKYWPINGFHAASFYLLDASNSSSSFSSTTYTIGGSTSSIYMNSTAPYGSGITVTSAGPGNAACTGIKYPTLSANGTITISGTVNAATTNAISGVNGTIDVAFTGDAIGTMSGSFISGTCNGANASPPTAIDQCSCALGAITP